MRLLTSAILASTFILGTANIASAQTVGALKDTATDAVKDAAIEKAKSAATDKATDLVGDTALGSVTSGSSSLGDVAGGTLGSVGSTSLSGSETVTAGKVLLNGGSKTDAAVAVGKSRIESVVKGDAAETSSGSVLNSVTDSVTGSAPSLEGLGGVAGGTLGSVGSTSLSGSETVTAGKVLLNGGSKTDAAVAVGKSRIESAVEGEANSVINNGATSYGSGTTHSSTPVIACPSGTKAQPDGTCMVTGNWGG